MDRIWAGCMRVEGYLCWKYSGSRDMCDKVGSQKGPTVTLGARVPERAIGDMGMEGYKYKQLDSAKCN